MSFSHVISQNVGGDASGLTRSKSYTGSSETDLSESISVGTDTPLVVAIDVSAVKSFYVVSDRQVTLETNNASAPTNTLTLKAGVPYLWNTDSYDTFKLTGDVTIIYVTNASGGTAQLEFRILQDATP